VFNIENTTNKVNPKYMIKNNITVPESFFLRTKKNISAKARHRMVFRLSATNVLTIFWSGSLLPALKKIARERAAMKKNTGTIISRDSLFTYDGKR